VVFTGFAVVVVDAPNENGDVVAVVVVGLFPNKIEFNVGVVVVVLAPNKLGVAVVSIYIQNHIRQ
jgi:hypothetical protein